MFGQQWPRLGRNLTQAEGRSDLEPVALEALSRLRLILTVVGKRLAGLDRSLVYPPALDTIANGIQLAANEVAAFIGDTNLGHLTNANGNADAALSGLAQIVVPQSSEDFLAAQHAADSYHRNTEQAFESSRAATSAISIALEAERTNLVQLSGDILAEKQRLSAVVSEHQAQFSAAQESRISESAARLHEQNEKFALLVSEYTQTLSVKSVEFSSLLESARKEHIDRLASLEKSFTSRADEIHEILKKRQTEINDLVGIVGNTAVTTGYQTSAERARRSARLWNIAAFVAMLGFIVVALCEFVPALGASFSWAALTGRVFVSLTVAVLVAYSAKQAGRYQRAFQRNEKMALELAAIGPFLAPLPVEKQHEFRLALGGRSFGREEASNDTEEGSQSLTDILKAKGVHDLIIDLVKTTKG